MFYVYEWYIKETGEIIYVGKGCKNRYKVRKHNRLFNEMIKRYDCESRIVKRFDSEKEAFEYEFERVFQLKCIGQCVCNINKGGAGGVTNWWTDEKREQYSKNNVMKSKEQRKRMILNNPMKDKKTSERVSLKKSRSVIIGEDKFNSIKSAQEHFGVSYDTIKKWCEKGISSNFDICRYEDSKQVEFKGGRYNKGSCKEIIYNDEIYESAVDLAKKIKVSTSTITNWAKKGFSPKGCVCRYADDKTNHYFVPSKNSELHSKPIIVNGVRYNSKKEAEEMLGLKKGYLAPYIAGKRKNMKYVCEYDNQQASNTNFDNSSVEASTTNE